MRLKELDLDVPEAPLPGRVAALLADADGRIERFTQDRRDSPIAAFVPSDFVMAWHALRHIEALNLAPGRRFVEWGSGAGVVTCLAALAGFDACGIEIEPDLVDLAEGLALDHGIEAQFARGTFVPDSFQDQIVEQRSINWLRSDGDNGYEELGLDLDDFDVCFAYPWPGEEDMIFDLFELHAAEGSLLLTYHGVELLLTHRKVAK